MLHMNEPSPWLDGEQQELWQDLLTVVIALPSALDRQLQRDAGMSNFEYSVLVRLSMADRDTMRLSELARDCDSTLPRLSKLMDRFEAREWIIRRIDPSDGRCTLATLTEAGRRKVVDSAPGHVAQVRRLVFDPLTAAQRRHLGTALSRVAETVRRETAAGPTHRGKQHAEPRPYTAEMFVAIAGIARPCAVSVRPRLEAACAARQIRSPPTLSALPGSYVRRSRPARDRVVPDEQTEQRTMMPMCG